MASGSGIVLHTGTYSQLRMDWSSTPNVSTNQSSFTATLYVQVTTAGWNIGPWGDYNGSYFGTSSGNTFDGSIGNISTGRTNLRTFNTTVNHANDGKGSINIVWKWGVNSSWGGVVNPSGSRTLTLDTIARATQPSVSPSTQTVHDNVTISTPRASGSFTHKLTYDFFGDKNIAIASNVATSHLWTLPTRLAELMHSTTSNGMTIHCETFNGSTSIGKKSTSMTVQIPDRSNFYPTIDNIILTEQSTNIPDIKDGFLQKKSKIKVDVTANGVYNSSIKSIEIKINGATYTNNGAVTDFLTQSGTQKAVVKVTDSRNRTATKEATYNVTAYDDPKITSLTALRCNESGVIDEEGTSVSVTFSTVLSNVQITAIKHKILYRKAETSEQYKEVSIGGSGSLTDKNVIINDIDIDFSYEFVLSVQDYFTTTTRTVEVGTGFTLLDFGANGRSLAIGEVASSDFNINIDTDFKKKVTLSGVDIFDIIKRYSSAPNIIVNPDFDTWRRFSSQNCTLNLTDSSQYFADRWNATGSGSFYLAREKGTNNPSYLRFVCNSETTEYININQYIYIGQRQLQGKPVSFSYVLNVDKDLSFIVALKESHAKGAKELKRWEFNAKAGANYISGTLEKAVFGYDDNHCCFMIFGMENISKATGAIRIHSCKLEIGDVPTQYIPPTYKENSDACSQAYQVIGTTTVAMAEQVSYFEGGVCVIDCVHPIRMYSLGVIKKAHSVETADLKLYQGGVIADKSKLNFDAYVSDGMYYGIRWTGISPNLNTTDRRPQYANMVGLRLEAEIYNT